MQKSAQKNKKPTNGKNSRTAFNTHCFALVICRLKNTDKWLCVKETDNRGWWIAGGGVEASETFKAAAVREAWEEAGVKIKLKGILKIENSINDQNNMRTRVIFYAESDDLEIKQIPDKESECADWLSIPQILKLQEKLPGLRGEEILYWPLYIMKGGIIHSLDFLMEESDKPIAYEKMNNFQFDEVDFSLNSHAFRLRSEDFHIKRSRNGVIYSDEKSKPQVKKEEEVNIEHYSVELSDKTDKNHKDSISDKKQNKDKTEKKEDEDKLQEEDVNEQMLEVDNLLYYALEEDNFECIRSAISMGANVNIFLNEEKLTPLLYAVQTLNDPLVKLLLNSGARLDITDSEGCNCFHFAVYSTEKILFYLIDAISHYAEKRRIAILNSADNSGNTPLHICAQAIKKGDSNKTKIFKLLVKNGANRNLKNLRKQTAIEILEK